MVGENEVFSGNSLSAEQLQALLRSPEGAALLRMLKSDGGKGMRAAAEALRRGDTEGAKTALCKVIGQQDAEELGKRLQRRL